jgi:predicted dinucleotide-binding enzyme
MMGSRDPGSDKVRAWVSRTGSNASAGTLKETAAFGELNVLATPWSAAENALRLAGEQNLAGKVLIDVTNLPVFQEGRPPSLALGNTDSGGEQVQRWLPDTRVVKAFNTVGNQLMFRPSFADGPPDMFICGNDVDAKRVVTDVLRDFGWPAIDIGGIEGARLLEPLALLWILYGIQNGNRNHAFKLLRQ